MDAAIRYTPGLPLAISAESQPWQDPMPRLIVQHLTVYRYHRPVRFGEHRLMFRPRDSHDLRLIDSALTITPAARVRWLHDVFSNSIAIASFTESAAELRFESRIEIEHYGLSDPDFPVEDYASTYPFHYASDEIPDLTRSIERHYPDTAREVDAWAKRFLNGRGTVETQDLLARINQAIHEDFQYETRFAVGVQSPVETLALGRGTCRDLALFMMEAVRSLGLAARFVSGYLYDPALDQAQEQADEPALDHAGAAAPFQADIRGAGNTHAWVQVFLPGAGWVEFDPTNGLTGGANLIRVAVARDPAQAIPLQGSYFGGGDDFIDIKVEVSVTKEEFS